MFNEKKKIFSVFAKCAHNNYIFVNASERSMPQEKKLDEKYEGI